MRAIRLANGFLMPADEAVTKTFGILAVRGAGKSNTAAVMAEEMFACGRAFVIIDPVGAWWGLRASGTGPGLPVPIFGGEHGDVPLDRGSGNLLADLIVEKHLSCVVDLSTFESEAAKKSFLLAFATRLYAKNREPLHLFLEEADDYIPQKPMRDEAHLLRAWENIVRRGRARGLGLTLITQRSAALNKNVLTQVETLFAMRTTGPQDRRAIEEWVKYNDAALDLVKSLPSLATGEAWCWSPAWLKRMERIRVRKRETFDSGATPVGGSRRAATMADIDLPKIGESWAAIIEKAKHDDPKELKRRVTELEKQLASASAKPKLVEVPVFSKVELDTLQKILAKLEALLATAKAKAGTNGSAVYQRVFPAQGDATNIQLNMPSGTKSLWPFEKPKNGAASKPTGDVELGAGDMKVLAAIAQHPDGVSQKQLAVLTGYKRSTRNTYLAHLTGGGYVERHGDRIIATRSGERLLPADSKLPTGDELRKYWMERLPEGERKIFEIIVKQFPRSVDHDTIEEITGYKRSTRNTYLHKLKARCLVSTSGSGLSRASESLFSN